MQNNLHEYRITIFLGSSSVLRQAFVKKVKSSSTSAEAEEGLEKFPIDFFIRGLFLEDRIKTSSKNDDRERRNNLAVGRKKNVGEIIENTLLITANSYTTTNAPSNRPMRNATKQNSIIIDINNSTTTTSKPCCHTDIHVTYIPRISSASSKVPEDIREEERTLLKTSSNLLKTVPHFDSILKSDKEYNGCGKPYLVIVHENYSAFDFTVLILVLHYLYHVIMKNLEYAIDCT